jgi:hypothetical protein
VDRGGGLVAGEADRLEAVEAQGAEMGDELLSARGDESSESPKGLYSSADKALEKVQETYDYWSGKLNDITMQMAFALIGANWAIFGNLNGILGNPWAKWSILAVLFAMVANVGAALALSQLTRRRVRYAESNLRRWKTEYQSSTGQDVAWPFTDLINGVGTTMRWARALLIAGSGVCLIIGAISK